MCLWTELQQQDRLLDCQVHLCVPNLKDIQETVLLNRRPRNSAILLLATLLRVSNHSDLHFQIHN